MTGLEKKYHRSELAKRQLRAAVLLFINSKDLSSVITLSSAASNILSQLVRKAGKEPFIDYARRVHDAYIGSTPKRDSYKNYIDNVLGVNVHKHMSPDCSKTCTLDLHKCAMDSITIAIADYVTLYGQKDDFVIAYGSWRWVREDGTKILGAYKNMPEKLRKTEKVKPSKADLEKVKNKVGMKQPETEMKVYQRFQLATNQLETAIMLFLTTTDKMSAITLAGAADVIFCELVNRDGKENFTDLTLKREGNGRSRKDLGKDINDLLCVNALKHFDSNDDEHIEMDVDECAIATILKALANYNMLEGKNDKLIIAFRFWCKTNLDPKRYNLGLKDSDEL